MINIDLINNLVSSSGDNTLKLWDIRNFSKQVNMVDNLTNVFSM